MIFYMYSFLYLQQYFVFFFRFYILFSALFIVDLFVVVVLVLHKTFFGSALYLLFRFTIFNDFG